MKVYMFSFSDCDQYYITSRRVAKALAQVGHDVTIIAYRGIQDTFQESQECTDGYRIIRVDLTITKLLETGLIRFIANILLRRYRDNQSSRRNDKLVESNKRKTPTWVMRLYYRIVLRVLYIDYYYQAYRVAKREHPDVYHAHDMVTLPIAWLCSRIHKTKLVYHMHELWIERGNKRSFLDRYLLSRLESFLIRRTDANIIAGYASGEELVRRYKIPKPVVVLNAPMYLKYTPSTIFRDKLKIPSGQKILLYAGIIGVSRGIEEIILSLKSLSDCCVVLLGYGPDYYVSKLKAFIDNSGVKDRVYLFGPVPSNEIVRYAMSADVGIVLQKNVCLNSYNASPNKLFEYMNAGLPVVGSNFPDIKRFVEGYSFGVTCNPESIQDIISAVQYVLADKGRYEKMRRNALKIAKVYNWENESHKIVAIYDRLAKEIMKAKLPKQKPPTLKG